MSNTGPLSSSRLMVKNLPKHLDELTMKKHFSKYGRVSDVKIIFKGNENRRFGFVGFIKDEEAANALSKCHNTYIDTSKITCEYAQTLDQLQNDSSKKYGLKKKDDRKEKSQVENYEETRQSRNKKNDESKKGGKSDDTKKEQKKREIDDFQDMMEIDKTKVKSKKKLKVEEETNDAQKEEYTPNWKKAAVPREADTNEIDEKRLFVTNIPFIIEKDEVKELFEKYGPVSECIVPKDKSGNSKGMAYISYEDPNDAIQAMHKMDNKIRLGRILHIKQAFKAKRDLYKEDEKKEVVQTEKSSYKKVKRNTFMRKLDDTSSWNTLFLNPNTVMDAVSKSYGISKAEMLDKEVENPAVRIATAETEVINETKEFLKANGINIEIFTTERKDCPRSKKVMLVKNINTGMAKKKLTNLFNNYGEVSKVQLPKNKAIGIVKFVYEDHAENAFKNLSEYSVDGTVLYLEWAPMNMMEENAEDAAKEVAVDSFNTKMVEEVKETKMQEEVKETKDDDVVMKFEKVEGSDNFGGPRDDDIDKNKTVFVKNQNFSTTEDSLWEFQEEIGTANDVKSLKIVSKDGLSCGFGFIEFHFGNGANKFIKSKQNSLLHDHSQKLSISAPKARPETKRKTVEANQKVTTKIVIRNLDFAANYREVKELQKNYGDVKAIRMPKKPDGNHRGFCFVEYMSLDDTKEAFEALGHTHFYGRKLVIEYAQE